MSFVLIEVSKLIRSPHIRESGFRNRPESRKFLLVQSGILGFGIRNTSQGIWNPTKDWNPESKFHWQTIRNPVPGIWYLLRRIHNPVLSWIPLHGAISMGALLLAYLRRVDVNEFRVKSYAILSLQPRKPIYFFIFLKFQFSWRKQFTSIFLSTYISSQWAKNKENQFFKTLTTQCLMAVALKMGARWQHSYPFRLKGHNSSLALFKDYQRLLLRSDRRERAAT